MKLRDAFALNADPNHDPDDAIAIDAGRCEKTFPPGVHCGARAKWLWRNQYRCNEHKEKK